MGSDKCYDKQVIKQVFLFWCIASLTSTSAQWVIEDEGCRTPDRGIGTCILANSCKPMVTFIQQNQPLTGEALGVLRRYQCGFEGSKVKVCCPDKPITLGRPTSVTTTNGNNPPDMSSHRNINLLPTKCGRLSPYADRIVNGEKTQVFEFPWMALISYQTSKGPEFRCGGSLINTRYVLTAAHCIATSLKMLGVRLGEHDIKSPTDCIEYDEGESDCAPAPQNINIEEAIAHSSWNNPPFSNDVGLIRLATPADIGVESVKPICLPVSPTSRNYNFGNGKKLIVTGWGATETGRPSNVLLKVSIPVYNPAECVKIYEKQANITIRQVCAGGVNGSDSCSGDSGGPIQVLELVNRDYLYYQLGIVSFGPKLCGTRNNPGVYTKVAFFMDWILDTMKP